ncbi:unnamed protein product [Closterium sp. NIES-65]|nr:unnamed protein product [Closterium sp. NIES-65]
MVLSPACVRSPPLARAQLWAKSQLPFLTECQAAWKRSFSGWDATSNCSKAVFVTCDQDGMLTSMGLLSQSLTGFLPSSVGAATRLSKLGFYNNMLSGSIPDTIGNLVSLESFDLSANNFSGGLPAAIGKLSLLTFLSVSQNRLAGAIPSTISALSNLEQLGLYNNSFSGSIPPAIYGLKALTVLEVGRNYFTGSFPSQFGTLSNLVYLEAGNMGLTGELHSSLGNLKYLQALYARENALQGSIPAILGSLSRLTAIQLGGNQLTGSIPASFSNLVNLQGFYMWNNQLNGSLNVITSCTALQQLAIQYNQFTGSIPRDVWKLHALNHFGVASNMLTGAIPTTIGSLVNLTTFNVSQNMLTGYLPVSMMALTKLEYLEYTPQVPPGLVTCPPSEKVQCGAMETTGNSIIVPYCIKCSDFCIFCFVQMRVGPGPLGSAKAAPGAVEGSTVCRQHRLDVLAAASGMECEWVQGSLGASAGGGTGGVSAVPAGRAGSGNGHVNEMASKHHPHLVRLLGFCIDVNEATEQTEQILIYEFMPNGDLERWLGPGAAQPLSLLQRLDVMIGVAEGLQYLHSFGIVHRDIKPANILIDRNMQAKVADFGLVRMGEGTTVGATRVMGTPGYVDPAYFKSQKATPMADVHSFGVVMLTILTARKAIYNSDDNQINLKQWVAPFVAANDGVTFKDPSLEAPPDIILRLARLALSCTAMPTALRPNMIKVLAELEALREEVRGATGDQMARRIDREIDDTHGHDLEEEVANAIRIGSSGGGVSGERSE